MFYWDIFKTVNNMKISSSYLSMFFSQLKKKGGMGQNNKIKTNLTKSK